MSFGVHRTTIRGPCRRGPTVSAGLHVADRVSPIKFQSSDDFIGRQNRRRNRPGPVQAVWLGQHQLPLRFLPWLPGPDR